MIDKKKDTPRYSIQTFGCQMNERDSEVMAGLLEREGYRPADSEEEADVIIFNTCSVREGAEHRAFSRIGQLKSLKEKRPEVVIALGGCVPQEEGTPEKVRRSLPHVDVLFGTHNLHELPELIERARQEKEMVIDIWEGMDRVVEDLPIRRASTFKAFVNITLGCNNFCSYCIVPYTRGREKSRRPEKIIEEVSCLGREGYKEVTLLGQNVNSYGRDLKDGTDFPSLLQRLEGVEGIERIRFMTSHPKDFSDRLIEVIAEGKKVCEHIHLPVQAGSSRVLARMNRRYTKESYEALAEKIYRGIPGVALTTDIIVGFPGETEEDFQDTLDLVRKVRFDNAFTFMYSPRAGTPAAEMEDQLPLEIKKERLHRLMEVQYAISLEKNRELVGSEVEVLVEGASPKDPNKLTGRTRTNKIVLFPRQGAEDLKGRLVTVLVESAQTWTLSGRTVN